MKKLLLLLGINAAVTLPTATSVISCWGSKKSTKIDAPAADSGVYKLEPNDVTIETQIKRELTDYYNGSQGTSLTNTGAIAITANIDTPEGELVDIHTVPIRGTNYSINIKITINKYFNPIAITDMQLKAGSIIPKINVPDDEDKYAELTTTTSLSSQIQNDLVSIYNDSSTGSTMTTSNLNNIIITATKDSGAFDVENNPVAGSTYDITIISTGNDYYNDTTSSGITFTKTIPSPIKKIDIDTNPDNYALTVTDGSIEEQIWKDLVDIYNNAATGSTMTESDLNGITITATKDGSGTDITKNPVADVDYAIKIVVDDGSDYYNSMSVGDSVIIKKNIPKTYVKIDVNTDETYYSLSADAPAGKNSISYQIKSEMANYYAADATTSDTINADDFTGVTISATTGGASTNVANNEPIGGAKYKIGITVKGDKFYNDTKEITLNLTSSFKKINFSEDATDYSIQHDQNIQVQMINELTKQYNNNTGANVKSVDDGNITIDVSEDGGTSWSSAKGVTAKSNQVYKIRISPTKDSTYFKPASDTGGAVITITSTIKKIAISNAVSNYPLTISGKIQDQIMEDLKNYWNKQNDGNDAGSDFSTGITIVAKKNNTGSDVASEMPDAVNSSYNITITVAEDNKYFTKTDSQSIDSVKATGEKINASTEKGDYSITVPEPGTSIDTNDAKIKLLDSMSKYYNTLEKSNITNINLTKDITFTFKSADDSTKVDQLTVNTKYIIYIKINGNDYFNDADEIKLDQFEPTR